MIEIFIVVFRLSIAETAITALHNSSLMLQVLNNDTPARLSSNATRSAERTEWLNTQSALSKDESVHRYAESVRDEPLNEIEAWEFF